MGCDIFSLIQQATINSQLNDSEQFAKELDILLTDNKNINIDYMRDKDGCSALMYVTRMYKSNPLIKVLLKHNANPNLRDQYGRTALHYAAATGSYDTIMSLVEVVDEVDALDGNMYTPLTYAVINSHSTPIITLLDAGANPNILIPSMVPSTSTSAMVTPLQWALTYGKLNVVYILVKYGAKFEILK